MSHYNDEPWWVRTLLSIASDMLRTAIGTVGIKLFEGFGLWPFQSVGWFQAAVIALVIVLVAPCGFHTHADNGAPRY